MPMFAPTQAIVVLVALLLAGCVGRIAETESGGEPGAETGGKTRKPAGGAADTPAGGGVVPGVGSFVAGPSPLRRLDKFEYDNVLRDLFGLTSHPAGGWLAEAHASGFENDVTGQVPNQGQVEEFILTAGQVATEVAAKLPQLFPCNAQQLGAQACADAFIERFVYRGFRRPLTTVEKQRARKAFALGAAEAGPEAGYVGGIKALVEYLLLAPQFWYRFERGLPAATGAAVAALSDFEVASRLSFFVQGTLPDDELLMAAAGGRLRTAADVTAQVSRLLKSEKASQNIREFHRQWLQMDRLEALDKPRGTGVGAWDAEVNAALIEGVHATVAYLFSQENADLSALLTGTSAFVNEKTAPFFGLTGVQGKELRRMALSQPRAGLITDAAFMAGLAHSTQTNPIARGNWIRDRFLCQPAPAPPADLNAVFPVPQPGLGARELLAQHRASPSCAGCHDLIDPIGFALESYDAFGRYRSEVNGRAVDTAGEIKGTRNADGRFTGALDLARHLAGNQDVQACVANHWFNFAFGRAPEAIDQPFLDDLSARLGKEGDLKKLIVRLATSEPFRSRPTVPAVKGGCTP